MPLAIVLINICADFIHQLLAFGSHGGFLYRIYREQFVLNRAILLMILENAIGSEAVFDPDKHVDGCRRQHKERGLGANSSKTSYDVSFVNLTCLDKPEFIAVFFYLGRLQNIKDRYPTRHPAPMSPRSLSGNTERNLDP